MSEDYSERRKHVRVFFAPDEKVEASIIYPPGSGEMVTVPVLNISEGGLCFVLRQTNSLAPGDTFVLTHLNDHLGTLLQGDVPMEIRWAVRHQELQVQSVGCEFTALPDAQRHCLASLITQKIASSRNV